MKTEIAESWTRRQSRKVGSEARNISLRLAVSLALLVSSALGANRFDSNRGKGYDTLVSYLDRLVPKDADFQSKTFRSGADFLKARFDSTKAFSFERTGFQKGAMFFNASFPAGVTFKLADFDSSSVASFLKLHMGGDSAKFDDTRFPGGVTFEKAQADSSCGVWFVGAIFSQRASFDSAQFRGGVSFAYAEFDSSAEAFFDRAHFWKRAKFDNARFLAGCSFLGAKFDASADVSLDAALFGRQARFEHARFNGGASLRGAVFDAGASFREAQLGNPVFRNDTARMEFSESCTKGDLDLGGSKIRLPIDFRGMKFVTESESRVLGTLDPKRVDLTLRYPSSKTEPWATFHNASIYDTIHVGTSGSADPQNFDFSLAQFASEERDDKRGKRRNEVAPSIIVYGPIRLRMQVEKFKYLHLCDTLSYFAKKNIIEYLKASSFTGSENTRARLELDYMLAKSVAHQEEWTTFAVRSWLSQVFSFKWLYMITLGYGYRPFRLFLWALGISVIFAIRYYCGKKLPFSRSIKTYIGKLGGDDKWVNKEVTSKLERILHCFWFSILMLLAIRLKPKLLVSFTEQEKRRILVEYLIGLFLYVLFIFGSKAGSITARVLELLKG